MRYYYPCMPNYLSPSSPFFKELDNNPKYVAEIKKNGWRCLVFRENRAYLMTRHNTFVKEPMEELKDWILRTVPKDTILDGELIHYRTKADKKRYYLFDIIMLKGKLLNKLPLSERRKILEDNIKDLPDFIELSQWVRIGKKNLYYQSINTDLNEGILLKKLDSVYPLSDRKCIENPFWIKVKKTEKHIKL